MKNNKIVDFNDYKKKKTSYKRKKEKVLNKVKINYFVDGKLQLKKTFIHVMLGFLFLCALIGLFDKIIG